MKSNINKLLRYILIMLVWAFSTACYTIIDIPSDYHENEINDNLSEEANQFNETDNNVSNDEYAVVNNYICNHGGNCCGHNHCHSYSNHHGYSCSGYCQLSFNWWSGSHHWNYYHHDYGHHHNHGYYSGYYDGYYDGYWWSYNDSDYSNNGNHSSDYTQERRDRSYTRDQEGNSLLSTSNTVSSSNQSSSNPLIQGTSSTNIISQLYTNNVSNRNNSSYKSAKAKNKKNKGKSSNRNLMGSIVETILYSSNTNKSKSKSYRSKGSSSNHSSSKNYTSNKTSNKKSSGKNKGKSSKSKRPNGRKRL